VVDERRALEDQAVGSLRRIPASLGSHRPRLLPSTCKSTGPAWRPTSSGRATNRAGSSSTKRRAKIFAALHGERGNDVPLFLSTTSADRVDGGWRLNGHKIFGSLTPVWDYGGFHAMDTSDEANPRIVHGFLRRDAEGIEIVDTWDTFSTPWPRCGWPSTPTKRC